MKKFKKVLVANRGEIAIRIFRACAELGIRTVGIYSKEDKYSLFRTKADESYEIGKDKGPIDAYLDMEEIIYLAKEKNVDAIHPGYGFLAENPEFVELCEKNGIAFIGPTSETMKMMGDKISSKVVAQRVDVPTIPGTKEAIRTAEDAARIAKEIGYPIMLKASNGGGGRGMRVVHSEELIELEYSQAVSESRKAFGYDEVFIEKYLRKPKHIEVQILGDKHKNIVHLYERDCSVQRRHQKIIEYAPAFSLPVELREKICADALKLANAVDYVGAGTLEFLVDEELNYYFIEMNPRIQVEHTVTEMITGIDIVQSQILIAEGHELSSQEIGIKNQEDVKVNGFSIQCRVTTEDPKSGFMPDTGKISVYRTGSGFGIRLDGGNGFTGSEITPYYDSLLVKTTSWDRNFDGAIRKVLRSIKEMRVRGVKTNIGFLTNVLVHDTFKEGKCYTNFIDETPELFDIKETKDRATKILKFIGNNIVNESKGAKHEFPEIKMPTVEETQAFGMRDKFLELGAEGFAKWVKDKENLLITDTTMRDAHQSLLATRIRTIDLVRAAEASNEVFKNAFSMEMWGGATFDVAYRFLKESPWVRLEKLRKKMPNVLLQMLLRASNAVGYTNYPDNVVKSFIHESARKGIDVFRIFDSLNWMENMKMPVEEALKTGKLVEGTLCFTGDLEESSKYNLEYYVKKAKELESMGVHILAIKDMAGLLKPYGAYNLVKTLKAETNLPIHLHTHDTSGNGVATILMASEAGVDIVDMAVESMSGLTSQPSMNSIIEALRGTKREVEIDVEKVREVSEYYQKLRSVYYKFESELKTPSTEIYKYEIPGGQYSNLLPQVRSLGLENRFKDVKEKYKEANEILGDIVKVTPSSKVVGDLAIFMTKNGIDKENILEKAKELSFPDLIVDYFKGMIGQPEGGFPKELQEAILKGQEAITVRPGELMEDADFDSIKKHLDSTYKTDANIRHILSHCLYPKVYEDYCEHLQEYNDISKLKSSVFFHGLSKGEECEVEIQEGKLITIKFVDIGEVKDDGTRTLTFEVNGVTRDVEIEDKNSNTKKDHKVKADPKNMKHLGSSIPGKVVKVLVKADDVVKVNQPLIIVEAMKMETTIVSRVDGTIEEILVAEGDMVSDKELLMTFK